MNVWTLEPIYIYTSCTYIVAVVSVHRLQWDLIGWLEGKENCEI